MHPKQIAKALIAFLGALGTWGITAAEDSTYTQAEMWGLCAVVVTGLAVYAYPNKPDGAPDPTLSEQHVTGDRGQSVMGIAVAALVIACVCLALILL